MSGQRPEMTPLNPPERQRTYVFPGGEIVSLDNVTDFLCSPSGTHRLKTDDGKLHIVPPRWLAIHIDADDWTL